MFELENSGATTIRLQSLTPITSDEVRVNQEHPRVVPEGQRHAEELCRTFRQTLIRYLAEDKTHVIAPGRLGDNQSGHNQFLGRFAEDNASNIALLLTAPLFLVKWLVRHGRYALGLGEMPATPRQQQIEQFIPPFHKPAQALAVGQRWLVPDAPGEPVERSLVAQTLREACQSMMKALEDLDAAPGTGLAVVDLDQTYRHPFVFQAKRRVVRWRQFIVSVEAEFLTGDRTDASVPPGGETPNVETVHEVLRVAPSPLAVTGIAVLGAAAGLVLNHPKGTEGIAGPLWWWSFSSSVAAIWVPTLVLAAVFFNIVDFTVLGPRLANHLDWRGALLIGLICGLGSGPITGAITQLPGVPITREQSTPSPSPSPSPSLSPSPSPGNASPSPTPAASPLGTPGAVPPPAIPSPTPVPSPTA